MCASSLHGHIKTGRVRAQFPQDLGPAHYDHDISFQCVPVPWKSTSFIHITYSWLLLLRGWLYQFYRRPFWVPFSTDFRLLLLLFTATAVHFCFLLFSIERTVILTHLLFFFSLKNWKQHTSLRTASELARGVVTAVRNEYSISDCYFNVVSHHHFFRFA